MERKSLPLEFKDIDAGKRTAVIAHAVYNNVDRTDDISMKGMFKRSWDHGGDIDFLFNHRNGEVVGNVKSVFEDDEKAYTEVKFGNWTLGNDVLEMADAKVLKGASFGYKTIDKEFVNVKGKKVRKLKEVTHEETSLLTVLPANPLAGITKLNKSLEEIKMLSDTEKQTLMAIVRNDQDTLEKLIALSGSIAVTDDLYSAVCWNISRRADAMGDFRSQLRYNAREAGELKQHILVMESFCRNAKASDECIKAVMNSIEETKQLISLYDTASTDLINRPDVSRTDNDSIRKTLLLINSSF